MNQPEDKTIQPSHQRVLVWDLATRLVHWLLVVLVGVSIYTGLTGGFTEMDVHMLSGYGILGLVTFRIAWGLIGPRHVRFLNFLRGPQDVFKHLRALPRREPDTSLGHNPAGALAIVALLLVLLVQAGTGLFTNDDIMLEGPLAHLIDYETSRELTSIHKTTYWVLVGLVGLHVIAIGFYTLYKGTQLVRPMITGYKRLPPGATPVTHQLWIALPLAGAVAGGVYWLVTSV